MLANKEFEKVNTKTIFVTVDGHPILAAEGNIEIEYESLLVKASNIRPNEFWRRKQGKFVYKAVIYEDNKHKLYGVSYNGKMSSESIKHLVERCTLQDFVDFCQSEMQKDLEKEEKEEC